MINKFEAYIFININIIKNLYHNITDIKYDIKLLNKYKNQKGGNNNYNNYYLAIYKV